VTGRRRRAVGLLLYIVLGTAFCAVFLVPAALIEGESVGGAVMLGFFLTVLSLCVSAVAGRIRKRVAP
jgi:hypothetical protein